MALLGAQLVLTLIMASVIQKIGSHYSLARWILGSTGLIRYLYPDNEELKSLAGVPKDKARSRRNNKYEDRDKPETFHVPRSLEINLDTAKVTPLDLIHLRFYSEFQWLVDFAVYCFIVYCLSELYNFIFPVKDEINLSLVWCFLEIIFIFKMLLTLTKQYFISDESIGERSTCIVSGCIFFLVAMIVLIIDEKNLEIGLDTAYQSFYQSATMLMETLGISNAGPASKLILKLTMAVWAAIIGAVFTFPGMRMARMHWDALRYCKESILKCVMLNVSFAMPFILVLLWIKPLSRDYLTERVFSGLEKPLLTSQAFESMRLILVIGTIILMLILLPTYLQAYLNMARDRVEEQKKEAGRITNVDLQKKIASVFYYLCVVALQYVCPIMMCFFLTLMYKTLGEYTWTGMFYESEEMCKAVNSSGFESNNMMSDTAERSIKESAEQYQLAFENLKKIFTVEVFRGIFGFTTWWCCFTWFATTSLGLLYQTYFRVS